MALVVPIINETLDDPLGVDGQENWSGGVNNTSFASALAENEFADGLNVCIRSPGALSLRPGSTAFGEPLPGAPQGLGYFVASGVQERLLAVVSGVLYYRVSGGTWTAVAGMTLNGTARVEMRAYLSKLYLFSGDPTDHVWSYDGTTLTDCGDPTTGTNPPQGAITAVQLGILFVAVDDFVYASNILETTFNRLSRVLRVTSGTPEAITALCPLGQTKLIVAKERSIWILSIAGDITTWSAYPLSLTIGCHEHVTMQTLNNDVVWLYKGGIYNINEQDISLVKFGESPLSLRIQKYIDRIKWSEPSSALVFDNYYLLAVTRNTGERDILAFDFKVKAWAGVWDTWEPLYWTTGQINGQQRAYCISEEDDQVREILVGDDDSNTYPLLSVTSRALTHGNPIVEKTTRSYVAQFANTFGATTIQLVNDRNATYTVGSYLTAFPVLWGDLDWTFSWGADSQIPRYKPIPTRRSLHWQFKLQHSLGVVTVRTLALSAFAEPFRME